MAARGKAEAGCSFGPRERNTYEDGSSVMLVDVAFSLLNKDPMAAAQLARASLSGGIVWKFPELCSKRRFCCTSPGHEASWRSRKIDRQLHWRVPPPRRGRTPAWPPQR